MIKMEHPTIIQREKYKEQIAQVINKSIIKVFTGQRRIGKSFLMLQTMDEIKKQFPENDLIYINKEHPDFKNIRDDSDLWNYIQERKEKEGKCFVFIDEVQEIANFEKALRGLNVDGGFDIYCTGSNATLLSGELSTLLTGRYFEIRVHGLSYKEFLAFHKLKNEPGSLMKYIGWGGMPFLIHLDDSDLVRTEYLRNVLNSVVYRDIVERFNVRNYSFLTNLLRYISDNVGSLVSANRINDYLKSQKSAVSTKTIVDYIYFLVSSFLVYKVKRYDITGKKLFEINDKYYFEDLGLQHTLNPYDPKRLNKYVENLAYKHLIESGYDVYVGKLGDKEIDFVAEKKDRRLYVQTALNVNDPKTFEREFGNLLQIKDNHSKYVITLDEYATGTHKGIFHKSLREFLMTDI